MISESFANIVNPLNNTQEDFTSQSDFNDYYKLTSDLDKECVSVIDEMDIPNYEIGESCIEGGRKYANSDKDYVTLRRENLELLQKEYDDLNNNMALTDFEKHSRMTCLMNRLLHNIITVSSKNDDVSKKNLENEQLARENDRIIKTNKDVKSKQKNSGLVKTASIAGGEENTKRMRIQYIIFMALIVIFLAIQLVIFFV